MKSVAILVPAFRPHLFFNKLLPELITQIEQLESLAQVHFEIIAVIPDKTNLENFEEQLRFRCLRLIKTSESGFSAPRNLLWRSGEEFDVNIFLDDDQFPNPTWLYELIQAVVNKPGYSLYVGDQYYLARIQDKEFAPSELLPPPSIGKSNGDPTSSNRITNTAFIRSMIEEIELPFPLYFSDGGEDVYFLHLLKQQKCKVFHVDNAAVIESWEAPRLTYQALMPRQIRGMRAYYKIRLIALARKWDWEKDGIRVYGRIILLVLGAPFLFIFLISNYLNPKKVLRARIFLLLSKIYHASTIPWGLKIRTWLGRDRFDIV